MNRIVVIGVIFLFVASSVIPISGVRTEQPVILSINGDTLYVGGSGPGNYTRIQDAIDNASDGDTVFVYKGSYHENVFVNKSIDLIGEDRETTIIGNVAIYDTYDVKISGFTTGRLSIYSVLNAIITNNNIFGNGTDSNGIDFWTGFGDIIISDNRISEWGDTGIYYYFYGNAVLKIINNTFSNNSNTGLYLSDDGHIIEHNIFIDNSCGLTLNSYQCKISNNTFEDNFLGLCIQNNENLILHNNFIKNKRHAFFIGAINNTWDSNYWNKPRKNPKPIFGNMGLSPLFVIVIGTLIKMITLGLLPRLLFDIIFLFSLYFCSYVPTWINFDWHPAKEPYDIGGVNNE